MTEKQFAAEELADRATKIYRLIDDLLFEDACRVINAVLTAKVEVDTEAELVAAVGGDNCQKLPVQDGEAGPSHPIELGGPDLEQIPLLVTNKLSVLVNHARKSGGNRMNQ